MPNQYDLRYDYSGNWLGDPNEDPNRQQGQQSQQDQPPALYGQPQINPSVGINKGGLGAIQGPQPSPPIPFSEWAAKNIPPMYGAPSSEPTQLPPYAQSSGGQRNPLYGDNSLAALLKITYGTPDTSTNFPGAPTSLTAAPTDTSAWARGSQAHACPICGLVHAPQTGNTPSLGGGMGPSWNPLYGASPSEPTQQMK